jgi:hypothetical protein
MSIIQEALKKAQATYTNKEAVKTEPVQKPHHASIPFTKLIPGIVLLIVAAGFGLNSFLSNGPSALAGDKQYHSVSYKTAATASEYAASPVSSVIQPGTALVNAPDLELNGIMYLDEKPRAIINGNTVVVGESVNGARIDAITTDSVLLNYNDLEITLKLKE